MLESYFARRPGASPFVRQLAKNQQPRKSPGLAGRCPLDKGGLKHGGD
jgi:hypothetical protein